MYGCAGGLNYGRSSARRQHLESEAMELILKPIEGGAHVTLGADTIIVTLKMFRDDAGEVFGEIVNVKVPEKLRGNEIAPRAVSILIGYAFTKTPATYVKAYCRHDNASSIQVWEKCHFTRQQELCHHETGDLIEFILHKSSVVRSFDVPATSIPPEK